MSTQPLPKKYVYIMTTIQSTVWILTLLLLSSCAKDLCEGISCENGGTCVEGDCQCPEGFQGNFCEFFDLQRYFGTYDISYEGCFTTSENHSVSLENIQGESNKFRILNLGDYECPSGTISLVASVTGNAITIETQEIDCGAIRYTFEGTGTFTAGSTITLEFTVTYDAGGFNQVDNCIATLAQ